MQQPVIIDFDINTQGVWIVVKNISSLPIISFKANFSAKITGMPAVGHDVSKRIIVSDYLVFKNCEYLVPGKQLSFFVESDVMFFKLNPPSVMINVSCQDCDGTRYNYMVKHNFEIYKQTIYTKTI